MIDKTIAIYVFIDDLLKGIKHNYKTKIINIFLIIRSRYEHPNQLCQIKSGLIQSLSKVFNSMECYLIFHPSKFSSNSSRSNQVCSR